jgi:protein MpaA
MTTSTLSTSSTLPGSKPAHEGRSVAGLLAPLDDLAQRSPQFLSGSVGRFQSAGRNYSLPRYVYLGPKGGGDVLRIGIFATIHGDEPEGALALTRFVRELEARPDIAKGFALFFYPVCNPTGVEDGTRESRNGKDLNREFWRNSPEPEVRFLETEIWTHAFHGIINLHTDDTCDGVYGYVHGEVLSEYLLRPALRAAGRYLLRDERREIDGFPARDGVLHQCYDGVLRAVPGLRLTPFELTFETPQHAPVPLQVEAFNAALESILTEYRQLMAIAQNI